MILLVTMFTELENHHTTNDKGDLIFMRLIDNVKGFFKINTKESKPGTRSTNYTGVGNKGYSRLLEYAGKRITYKKETAWRFCYTVSLF